MKELYRHQLRKIVKLLARLTVAKFRPTVVGVTGTVGKTSTREAIYTVLYQSKVSRRTRENLNNELGMPLTILGDYAKSGSIFFWFGVIVSATVRLMLPKSFSSYPQVLILEYAADKPGDLAYLISIARPDISVVTAVGDMPVHAEFYDDADAVAREKRRLVEALPQGGTAILNADDRRVLAMREATDADIITYGFSMGSIMRIFDLKTNSSPISVNFKLEYKGASVSVALPETAGKSQAYAGAAATCVGIMFGMDMTVILKALSSYKPPAARMNFVQCKNGMLLVDDSYNAAPLSVSAAIETLKELPGKRKVAILGDMRELGMFSERAHEEIGRQAHEVFDVVVAVGEASKGMKGDYWFSDAQSALEPVKKLLQPGDLVLVKASHSIGLDAIAEELRK